MAYQRMKGDWDRSKIYSVIHPFSRKVLQIEFWEFPPKQVLATEKWAESAAVASAAHFSFSCAISCLVTQYNSSRVCKPFLRRLHLDGRRKGRRKCVVYSTSRLRLAKWVSVRPSSRVPIQRKFIPSSGLRPQFLSNVIRIGARFGDR